MPELAFWAVLNVLPGREEEAAHYFERSRENIEDEPGTTSFVVVRIDEHTYGVFETFEDQSALDEHTAREAGSLTDRVGTVFSDPPRITSSVVVQRTRTPRPH